jgi:hypothetical protein
LRVPFCIFFDAFEAHELERFDKSLALLRVTDGSPSPEKSRAKATRSLMRPGLFVEATEGLNRGVDGILGLCFVRDVERNSPYTLSEVASDFNESLRIAGRGHDAVSGF